MNISMSLDWGGILFFVAVLTVIFIYFWIWFNKKVPHKINKTILLTSIILACVLFGLFLTNLPGSKYIDEWYASIDIPLDETIDLHQVRVDGRSYLAKSDGTEIQYLNDELKSQYADYYQVIYFEDYEDYSVVIYSGNIDDQITYDRFTFPSYEHQNYGENRLYVIDKGTHRMILFMDYDLVGQTIDLLSFKIDSGVQLNYAIFQPLQDKIRNIGMIDISTEYSDNEYHTLYLKLFYSEMAVSYYHFYSEGDPSWITYYAVTSSISVWADSYGDVYGETYRPEGTGYSGGPLNEELLQNTFIAEGFIKVVDDKIYFVGVTNDTDNPLGSTGYSVFLLTSTDVYEVERLTYSDTLEDISVISNWLND